MCSIRLGSNVVWRKLNKNSNYLLITKIKIKYKLYIKKHYLVLKFFFSKYTSCKPKALGYFFKMTISLQICMALKFILNSKIKLEIRINEFLFPPFSYFMSMWGHSWNFILDVDLNVC